MNELITCPRCGDSLEIPAELLGKPVRCAACRTVFTPTSFDTVSPTPPPPERAPRARPVARPTRHLNDYEPAPQKSNGWVWVLMMLMTLISGGFVLLCTGFMSKMMNPEMEVHDSAEGKFRVATPGAPTPLTRGDDQAPIHGVVAIRPENQETYQVLSAKLPVELRKVDLRDEKATRDLLTELAKRNLPGLAAGPELQRHQTNHGPYPALDVHFQQGKGLFKVVTIARIVVANGREYILSVQGNNIDPHVWYVRRFFTSFEPIK